ncbi:hypothetical protein M405DRAFT_614774 [Rhizopogon salebrosus TDB-379]|nr:hypothetical protein M405DRAFT_614774 [Rhizopogon salebrosus TDB-379]
MWCNNLSCYRAPSLSDDVFRHSAFKTFPYLLYPNNHPVSCAWRHLRKLLPSSFRKGTVLFVQNDEPYDPLNVPAILSRHQHLSHSAQGTGEVHSRIISGENSKPVLASPITRSSATASTTITLHAGHAPAAGCRWYSSFEGEIASCSSRSS